ncbi:MAG: hypothetical protein SCARUB_01675 [Candidatus Scalindua rubra]|uniref:Uncharacterized protein n=1 Tax=Candidatus Scalindua rubra TaxID=1872076 RepID=A0A1E3XC24_9BACT|nr:MAG: hypothetical protein SCARUB_01675 [Candidatus Scalindua rubra]
MGSIEGTHVPKQTKTKPIRTTDSSFVRTIGGSEKTLPENITKKQYIVEEVKEEALKI